MKNFLSVPPEYLIALTEVLSTLDKMYASLSDQEKEVLEFLRNYYSHFQINKYRAQYAPKTRTHSLDLNGEPRRVIRMRISNWVENFGGDSSLMARHFALKVAPFLESLEREVVLWSKM